MSENDGNLELKARIEKKQAAALKKYCDLAVGEYAFADSTSDRLMRALHECFKEKLASILMNTIADLADEAFVIGSKNGELRLSCALGNLDSEEILYEVDPKLHFFDTSSKSALLHMEDLQYEINEAKMLLDALRNKAREVQKEIEALEKIQSSGAESHSSR